MSDTLLAHFSPTADAAGGWPAARSQPLFHGTSAELRPGDHVESGHPSNWDGNRYDLGFGRDDHVYATHNIHQAWDFAERSRLIHGGEPHVHEVHPTGRMYVDPEVLNYGTADEHPSYRSRHPLRVGRNYDHMVSDDYKHESREKAEADHLADMEDRFGIHESALVAHFAATKAEGRDYEGETGNPTHITRTELGSIPVAAIAHLQGAAGERPGEHRNRQGAKWEDFKRDIAERGIQHPVFITVDHGEEPRISEGSHRRDAAVELGHTHIPYEATYFGNAQHEGTIEERARRSPHHGGAMKTKAEVSYRDARGSSRRCGSCVMYRPSSAGDEQGACTLVKGEILAAGTCDRWAPKGKTAAGYGRGREHWSKPPEQRTGQPGEYMYRVQPAEYHERTMAHGIEPRPSAGMLPGDPEKAVYMTTDDHSFHALREHGLPGSPEWERSHRGSGYYKIDVSGLPLTEDRTFTEPGKSKRAWMATEHVGPERITPHVPGTDHGVSYDDWPEGSFGKTSALLAHFGASDEEPNRAVHAAIEQKVSQEHPDVNRPVTDQTGTLRAMLGRASFFMPRGEIDSATAGPEHGSTPLELAHHAAHVMTDKRQGLEEARPRESWDTRPRPSEKDPDERHHGHDFTWHYALALDGAGHQEAGEAVRHHYPDALVQVAHERHARGLSRDFPGSGLSPDMPPDLSHLPPMIESQRKGLASADSRDYSRRMLDVASHPEPGLRIWRGERRPVSDDIAGSASVGMHWSAKPEAVITSRDRGGDTKPVVWQARLEHPESQAIPRSHPMWRGIHESMPSEAEVRLRPGSPVHVEGAWVGPAGQDSTVHPLHPQNNPPGWKWHELGRHLPVSNRPGEHSMIDYSGVGFPREALLEHFASLRAAGAWDYSGSEKSGVYLRFGDWPHDERSFSPAGGYHEDGVSAYDLDKHGNPAIDHGFDRDHVHDEHCDKDCDIPTEEYGNDPKEELNGRVGRAQVNRRYGGDKPSETAHLVRGEITGVGYDGEPLLRHVRRVGDWMDHRHLFIPGAKRHPLARGEHDEDYEPPEEKPPGHHAAVRAPDLMTRFGSMPFPDYDTSSEMPVGRGVYWRAHLHSRPFDEQHASSRPLNSWAPSPVGGQRGYSAMRTPQQLGRYMDQMGWLDSGDARVGQRDVLAFHGREVGRGVDNEPLVVPEASPHCCGRVIHSRQPWHEFENRIWGEHAPEVPHNEEHVRGAEETIQRAVTRHQQRRQATASALPGHFGGPFDATDWDEVHPDLDEIHRGIGVQLPPHLHQLVHDRRRRPEDRARALLDHVRSDPEVRDSGLGTHWTSDEGTAESFGDHRAQYLADGKERPGTSVVLHAAPPGREEIDEHAQDDMGVYSYHGHGEREVPVHQGSPLKIRGISWAPHHDSVSDPRYYGSRDGEYEHHRFADPQYHYARLLAHFGAYDHDPDWDLEHPYYYHVSPHKIPVGTMLKARGKGWANWDQSSGEHVYMTRSRQRAEDYHAELFSQGHPELHMHEVKAHGHVEEDPHDDNSVRTKDPVEVIFHHGDDDDDEEMHHEAMLSLMDHFGAVSGHGMDPEDFIQRGMSELSPADRQFFSDALEHRRRGAPPSEPINAEDASWMQRGFRMRDRLKDAGFDTSLSDKDKYPRGVNIRLPEGHGATLSPNTGGGWHVRTYLTDHRLAPHVHHDLPDEDEHFPAALHRYYGSPQIQEQLAAQRADAAREHEAVRHDALMAHFGSSNGDRYVTCDQGHTHWGAYGAAGLLIRHRDPDDGRTRYLLQKRAPHVDHGSTWSVPGGARGSNETPRGAALRETREEIGSLPADLTHHHTVEDNHGGWSYHTVVMDSPERFAPRGGGATEHETAGTAWLTPAEIADLPLHPGFAKTWDKVRRSRVDKEAALDPDAMAFRVHMMNMHGKPDEPGMEQYHEGHARDHEDMENAAARGIELPPEYTPHPYRETDWERRQGRGRLPDAAHSPGFVAGLAVSGVSGVRDVPDTGHRTASAGPFWHGSISRVEPGEMIDFHEAPSEMGGLKHNYFSTSREVAEDAADPRNGLGHGWVHRVEPTGASEPDYGEPQSWRSPHPLRVLSVEPGAFGPRHPHPRLAASGYDLSPGSGMISLDIPPGTIERHPGGVDDHHITIAYLGKGLDDEAYSRACHRARQAAAAIPGPFGATLHGVGTFPPSGSSDDKVPAYLNVHALVPYMDQLRSQLQDLSASEHSDWKPHVTLAYLEPGEPLPPDRRPVGVRFTHLSVHRGDDVARFPLGG